MNLKENMIVKFRAKHGSKFDYSYVYYTNNMTNIKIICPIHGMFEQTPKRHLISDTGCNGCSNDLKRAKNAFTLEEFCLKSLEIWGNKYDYSKVNYINSHTKVIIICNGIEYLQKPYLHLLGKAPENKSIKKTEQEFFAEANEVFNYKYDYSITKYISSDDYIEFIYDGKIYKQRAVEHLQGHQPDNKISVKKYIKICNDKFNNKFFYPYIDKEFININSKITIFCKIHGESIQCAYVHLHSKCGCKYCKNLQSKGVLKIYNFLKKNNIKFSMEYKFPDCRNILELPFDFYLTDYNIAIEYDGEQHFKSIEFFGGDESFKKQKANDNIKNIYCFDNNIIIIRIPYFDYNNIENILGDTLQRQ